MASSRKGREEAAWWFWGEEMPEDGLGQSREQKD